MNASGKCASRILRSTSRILSKVNGSARDHRRPACCLALVVLFFCAEVPPAAAAEPEKSPQRIVFLGDSITDGNTYPLLIRAALEKAGRPVPICINAGVAGDTAAGMLARLDRDVFVHRPTLVTISAGINDVLRNVSVQDYARDMQAIAARMQREKVPLLILTTTVLGEKHATADKRLVEFNAALRRIAEAERASIAEVNQQMQLAREQGVTVLEDDQVHITLAGYRVMARAILDALHEQQTPVPEELQVSVMPGVVQQWKLRPTTAEELPLDEKTVLQVAELAGWKDLELPLKEAEDHWWMDQERQRGFATSLGKRFGSAKRFLARATVTGITPQQKYLNIGAQVETVWLNGKLVYKNEGWTGWHAGKERISVTFTQGENILVIEAGDTFFISLTPDREW